MSVDSKIMQLIKNKNLGLRVHQEIIYRYIVIGNNQGTIANDFGVEQWSCVSPIIRAYNFNSNDMGISKGKYGHASKEQVYKFVKKYYPGFIYDDSIRFDNFLSQSGNTKNITSAPVKKQKPLFNKAKNAKAQNKEIHNKQAVKEKFNIGDFNMADMDSTFPQTIGLIGIIIMISYYLLTSIALPAIDIGTFSLTSILQKDTEIKTTQLKNSEYIGEVGWMKKADGLGLLKLEQSQMYIGRFKNGKRQGEGIEIFNDGTIEYIGNFNNNKQDGFGMTVGDEYMYIGEMKKGNKHGIGAYVDTTNEIIEINEYKKNKLVNQEAKINHITGEAEITGSGGYQVFEMENGGVLVGDYKKNDFTVNVADGYFYFGMYKDGATNGYGIRINSNGNVEYGNKKGKKTDEAILYLDGEAISIGEFKGQTKEGYGMEYLLSGEVYVGNYRKSKRHGKGTYMFLNGTTKKVRYKNGNLINE